ncbi:MAG: hypothetical protein NXI32_09045 [bacterium]|nr:hypothetical protein [bacterium]
MRGLILQVLLILAFPAWMNLCCGQGLGENSTSETDRPTQRRLPIPGVQPSADIQVQADLLRTLREITVAPSSTDAEGLSEQQVKALEETFQSWQKQFQNLGISSLDSIPRSWVDDALEDPKTRQLAHQLLKQYARDRELKLSDSASIAGPDIFPARNRRSQGDSASRSNSNASTQANPSRSQSLPASGERENSSPQASSAASQSQPRAQNGASTSSFDGDFPAAPPGVDALDADQVAALQNLLKQLIQEGTQEDTAVQGSGQDAEATISSESDLPSLPDKARTEPGGARPLSRSSKGRDIAASDASSRSRDANSRDANSRDANSRDANSRDANSRDANSRDANSRDANSRGGNSRGTSSQRSWREREQRNAAPPPASSPSSPRADARTESGIAQAAASQAATKPDAAAKDSQTQPEWDDWETPEPSFGLGNDEAAGQSSGSVDKKLREAMEQIKRAANSQSELQGETGNIRRGTASPDQAGDGTSASAGKVETQPPQSLSSRVTQSIRNWLEGGSSKQRGGGQSGRDRGSNKEGETAEGFDVRSQLRRLGLGNTLKAIVENSLREEGIFEESENTPAGSDTIDEFLNRRQIASRNSSPATETNRDRSDNRIATESQLAGDPAISAATQNARSGGTKRLPDELRSSGAGKQSLAGSDASDSMLAEVWKAVQRTPTESKSSSQTSGTAAKPWSPPMSELRFRWGWQQTLTLLAIGALVLTWWFVRRLRVGRESEKSTQNAWVQRRLCQGLRTRDDVVQAFHDLVLRLPKPAMTWWAHRSAAEHVRAEQPEYAEAVSQLSEVYEQARYLPPEAQLTSDQMQRAERAVRSLETSTA